MHLKYFQQSYDEVENQVHDLGECLHGLGAIPAASFTKLAQLCCFEPEADGIYDCPSRIEHDLVAELAIIMQVLLPQAAQAESLGDRVTRYL